MGARPAITCNYRWRTRNFMYAETDEDISFLPNEPSLNFGIGSPSVSINMKPPVVEIKPAGQLVRNATDLGDCLPDVLELQNDNACHLKIFAITHLAWKGHLDNQLDVELLDLHDRCYARQAIIDNFVNQRARELLKIVDQMKAEFEVLKEREKTRMKNVRGLKQSVKLI
nr:hypothetical protein [Tanacetum cinerariifolium]